MVLERVRRGQCQSQLAVLVLKSEDVRVENGREKEKEGMRALV